MAKKKAAAKASGTVSGARNMSRQEKVKTVRKAWRQETKANRNNTFESEIGPDIGGWGQPGGPLPVKNPADPTVPVGGTLAPANPPPDNTGGGTSTDDGWAVADWMLSVYGFTAGQRASLRNQLWGANSELRLYTESSFFGEMLITKLYETSEFQERFPVIADQWRRHQSDPTVSIYSPEQVMQYEAAYDTILPKDTQAMFDKKKTVTDLMLGGVDLNELKERVDYATWASATAPDSVRKVLAEKYGVTGGNLVGFYLDPAKGEEWLKRQTTVASVRAAGLDAGIDLSWDWADRAQSTLGVDYGSMGEINARMQQAQMLKNLSSGLGGTVSDETRANSEVLNDASAKRRVASVAAQRTGRFNSSGGAAESAKGVSGLRSSQST